MGSGDVEPGRHIRRAGKGIGTDRFYTDVLCRTAFSFGLPRIFVDLVLPRLPGLNARLQDGGRLLAVGCCGGWALVQIAERFPATFCVGIDVEPYSIELARQLIAERGLTDRCQTRLQRVDELDEDEVYDPGY